MKKIILNLGCGKTRIPGSIGVDRVEIDGYVDVVHNLDILPYPFKKNSVDEIHMYHVLEHLSEPIKKIEEMSKILKPGGLLYLRVPHFSSMGAFTDMTHVRPFSVFSFDCFVKENYHHFYTPVTFEVIERRIKYFGLYPNKGIYEKYIHKNRCPWIIRPIIRVIDSLINLSPLFFERFWCYWIGGATESCITLKKINEKYSKK